MIVQNNTFVYENQVFLAGHCSKGIISELSMTMIVHLLHFCVKCITFIIIDTSNQ